MNVLVYAPGAIAPELKAISNDLKSLQAVVGGLVQPVPFRLGKGNLWVVCNEEGLVHDLPYNRRVGDHEIVGTFFVCRPGFKGLKDSDLVAVREVLG